jgi:hypothetical protein
MRQKTVNFYLAKFCPNYVYSFMFIYGTIVIYNDIDVYVKKYCCEMYSK